MKGSKVHQRFSSFVHEQLEWLVVDQSPEQSETEWLCVDVAGYTIINTYKSPPSRVTPTAVPTLPTVIFSLRHFGHFVIETLWSPRHFGHLSHSCVKTRRSSVD